MKDRRYTGGTRSTAKIGDVLVVGDAVGVNSMVLRTVFVRCFR